MGVSFCRNGMMNSDFVPALPDGHPAPSQAEFRNAMSRLAAAVNIITTDGPAGRCGFTASAVCSVTDTPPTLLVCVNRQSTSLPALLENGVLCVNTLAPAQEPLSRLFGSGVPMEERFADGEWLATPNGGTRLAGALVAFDCRIASVAEEGTHKVLFCRVESVHESREDSALVYFRRGYHDVGAG